MVEPLMKSVPVAVNVNDGTPAVVVLGFTELNTGTAGGAS